MHLYLGRYTDKNIFPSLSSVENIFTPSKNNVQPQRYKTLGWKNQEQMTQIIYFLGTTVSNSKLTVLCSFFRERTHVNIKHKADLFRKYTR
jgi:hypothetical protein